MNVPFNPLQNNWAPINDMKQTPKVWRNYYSTYLIQTTLPPNTINTQSNVEQLMTPTANQLNNISQSHFLNRK